MSQFRKDLDQWKRINNLHGPHALPKFVMFHFLERVAKESGDFVFKGGNLLWFYIKTPRPTVDLDFVTMIETDSEKVLETLGKICEGDDLGIIFKITSHKIVSDNDKIGLAIDIAYRVPEDNVQNKFSIDIVLGVQTDIRRIAINKSLVNAASPENIVCDKLQACRDFGAGNTRAKDFDDLYRITENHLDLNFSKLKKLSELRGIELELEFHWISEITMEAWRRHLLRYPRHSLPTDLYEVFESINAFLYRVKSTT